MGLVVLEESKDDFQEFFINHFGPNSDFKSLPGPKILFLGK